MLFNLQVMNIRNKRNNSESDVSRPTYRRRSSFTACALTAAALIVATASLNVATSIPLAQGLTPVALFPRQLPSQQPVPAAGSGAQKLLKGNALTKSESNSATEPAKDITKVLKKPSAVGPEGKSAQSPQSSSSATKQDSPNVQKQPTAARPEGKSAQSPQSSSNATKQDSPSVQKKPSVPAAGNNSTRALQSSLNVTKQDDNQIVQEKPSVPATVNNSTRAPQSSSNATKQDEDLTAQDQSNEGISSILAAAPKSNVNNQGGRAKAQSSPGDSPRPKSNDGPKLPNSSNGNQKRITDIQNGAQGGNNRNGANSDGAQRNGNAPPNSSNVNQNRVTDSQNGAQGGNNRNGANSDGAQRNGNAPNSKSGKTQSPNFSTPSQGISNNPSPRSEKTRPSTPDSPANRQKSPSPQRTTEPSQRNDPQAPRQPKATEPRGKGGTNNRERQPTELPGKKQEDQNNDLRRNKQLLPEGRNPSRPSSPETKTSSPASPGNNRNRVEPTRTPNVDSGMNRQRLDPVDNSNRDRSPSKDDKNLRSQPSPNEPSGKLPNVDSVERVAPGKGKTSGTPTDAPPSTTNVPAAKTTTDSPAGRATNNAPPSSSATDAPSSSTTTDTPPPSTKTNAPPSKQINSPAPSDNNGNLGDGKTSLPGRTEERDRQAEPENNANRGESPEQNRERTNPTDPGASTPRTESPIPPIVNPPTLPEQRDNPQLPGNDLIPTLPEVTPPTRADPITSDPGLFIPRPDPVTPPVKSPENGIIEESGPVKDKSSRDSAKNGAAGPGDFAPAGNPTGAGDGGSSRVTGEASSSPLVPVLLSFGVISLFAGAAGVAIIRRRRRRAAESGEEEPHQFSMLDRFRNIGKKPDAEAPAAADSMPANFMPPPPLAAFQTSGADPNVQFVGVNEFSPNMYEDEAMRRASWTSRSSLMGPANNEYHGDMYNLPPLSEASIQGADLTNIDATPDIRYVPSTYTYNTSRTGASMDLEVAHAVSSLRSSRDSDKNRRMSTMSLAQSHPRADSTLQRPLTDLGMSSPRMVHIPYVPELQDELGLDVGDMVVIEHLYVDNWALGRCVSGRFAGKSGVFPVACLDADEA